MDTSGHNTYYVGHKALKQPGSRRPYQSGAVDRWEDMEAIWEHCFTDCLRVDTAATKIFLTEPHMPPRANRETTIETMFELFNADAAYLHVQPVLALFSAGLTSGCVVDSGELATTIYPVSDGYHLTSASKKLTIGGAGISNILANQIVANGKNYDSAMYQKLRYAGNDILRSMKESLCYVQPKSPGSGFPKQRSYDDLPNVTLTGGGSSSAKTTLKFQLPDGNAVECQESDLHACTERLFDPVKFGTICEPEEDGLHTAIYKSVMKAGVDVRRSLVGAVVLTGGNTMFPGLPERLTTELKAVMSSSMSGSLKVIAPADRNNAVWSGGSILTSLSTFDEQWITSRDYDEMGPEIVHEKCSIYL